MHLLSTAARSGAPDQRYDVFLPCLEDCIGGGGMELQWIYQIGHDQAPLFNKVYERAQHPLGTF